MSASVGVVLDSDDFLAASHDSVEVNKTGTSLVTTSTASHGNVTRAVSTSGSLHGRRQLLDGLAAPQMLVDRFSEIRRSGSGRAGLERLELDFGGHQGLLPGVGFFSFFKFRHAALELAAACRRALKTERLPRDGCPQPLG